MSASIEIKIALTPVLEKDTTSENFLIFFSEFPEAIGWGSNESEAFESLKRVFSIMLNEEEEMKKKIVENYMQDAKFNDHNHNSLATA